MITITEELNELNKDLSVFEKFMKELPNNALRLGVRVLLAFLIFFIGSKLIKIIRKVLKKSLVHAKVESGVVTFLDGLTKAVLYFLLIMIIANNLGFDATSIVALLGSIGVTIGLALQGSLSNFAGGILILILKPFRVGDFIHENSSGTEGTVTEISIFYTKLLTVDQKTIVLPNGNLSNSSIINFSTSPTRRVDVNMSISYGSDILKAKEVLREVILKQDTVLKDMNIIVCVDSLDSSEVVITTRCYCKNADYWNTKWALTESMKLALDREGIEIPFPQLDVHMR